MNFVEAKGMMYFIVFPYLKKEQKSPRTSPKSHVFNLTWQDYWPNMVLNLTINLFGNMIVNLFLYVEHVWLKNKVGLGPGFLDRHYDLGFLAITSKNRALKQQE